jgi:hypothetical protein
MEDTTFVGCGTGIRTIITLNPKMNISASRLIGLASVSLITVAFVSCSRPAAGYGLKPAEAAGTIVAQEMVKLIPGQGQILLFIRDTSTYPNEAGDAQFHSFTEALQKEKRLSIAAVVKIPINFSEVRVNPGGLLDRDQLSNELADHPGLAGVVSFVGFPQSASDVPALQNLKCVALFNSTVGEHIRPRIAQSGLSVAIVARPQPEVSGEVKSVRDSFNQSYIMIESGPDGHFSPDSLSLLPES